MSYSVEVGDLHENKLSCEFSIVDQEGYLIVEGWVKWDGCMNWRAGEGGSYEHFCGPEEAVALGEAFAAAWRVCGEKMGDKIDIHYPQP